MSQRSDEREGASDVRDCIEAGFERWGHFVFANRFAVIAIMLALSAGLGSQLPRLEFDTSEESMFQKGDPTLTAYRAFREQFGREDLIIIAIESSDVFSERSLGRLRALHEELEEHVPNLIEVISLVNTRSTRGEAGELVVGELMEDWPETDADRADLRDLVMRTDLYLDRLISRDRRVTTVALRLESYSQLGEALDPLEEIFEADRDAVARIPLTGEELAASVSTAFEIVDRHRAEDFEIHVAGAPIINVRIMFDMIANIRTFVGLGLMTIGLLLIALFRRLAGLFLPLLVVVLSIIATFGTQAMRGTPAGAPTQIVPSFLLAVGVGSAVHILVVFFQSYDRGMSKADAVARALGHSGLAVVMTALTTAGGLLSFRASTVAPVKDIGTLAPLGVMAGLFYCLILLPALLSALPLRRKEAGSQSEGGDAVSRALVRIGDGAVRRPLPVLVITSLIIVTAIFGALQIRFHHDTLEWFAEGDPIRVDTQWIDARLAGSMALEVVVHTGEENGFHDPGRLQAFDALSREVRTFAGDEGLAVRKTSSIGDVVKEINQALNDNDASAYTIPNERPLIAQELLLFENSGSDDLEDFVDSQFSTARFSMQLPYKPPSTYHDFIPSVDAAFRRAFGPDVEIETTGFMALMAASVEAIAHSLFTSYALALAIITPLMMILIGTLRGGLASMVPNLAPIVLVLGFMGWYSVELDLFTLLIGSIAIGLAVDDTIHFMHNFYRYYRETGNTRSSVRRTLETTGVAMLVTSIVLTSGFFTYLFAEMNNLFWFGLLTGMSILLAFLADIVVSPALVSAVTGGWRREEEI